MTGYGLEHWPWTESRKQQFLDSRLVPAHTLVSAIGASTYRPTVFIQISGINYYGLRGDAAADESTGPGDDFLSRLTVDWEAATEPLEGFGVRRIVARSAVVLAPSAGLFPLMALPVRLFVGGPLGGGEQAVPWIHLAVQVEALRFLLERGEQAGVFNLVAPTPTSNAAYMRAIATASHRPYWMPTPALMLRLVLGEMSTLVVDGRYSTPKRLLAAGYRFRFPTIADAMKDLVK